MYVVRQMLPSVIGIQYSVWDISQECGCPLDNQNPKGGCSTTKNGSLVVHDFVLKYKD